MPTLINHPTGHYQFLPGIAPYSCGVVAEQGYEVVRVTLRAALTWREGFDFVDRLLAQEGHPRASLCAMELRSRRPFTMQGFVDFNRQYCADLEEWGVYVDGVNPVARTNVCPVGLEADEPVLEAFSFVRPNITLNRRTFIVAGAGELIDGTLDEKGIVRRSETSPDAILEKAAYVCSVMEERLLGIGADWGDVTSMTAYTIHPLEPILEGLILARMPAAQRQGVRWLYSRPPVIDIEFEMDLRGVATEWVR
jgi:hypothetical protein